MRQIPSIEQLRQRPAMRALETEFGREALVTALRAEADALRRGDPGSPVPDDLAAWFDRTVPARLAAMAAPSLSPVINATGVILHTNLGRAPLPRAAVERIASLADYCNLEYDLDSGSRGKRDRHAERLLCRLTGAEAAVVVNNNAAAALLTLAAIAAGREVIVSRGELVEIGGGFRVPDVLAQSGAVLREVGTTNRTRAADYAAAITDRTAALLRVHPSNFRIEGFTERPDLPALVAVARRFDLPVIEDLGSGWLGTIPPPPALRDEPTVRGSLADGAAVVLFSGDKLLGGPQSGIIAGRASLLAVVRRHPLMRALRVDKITYAALEATLQEYAAGRAQETVPAVRMLTQNAEAVRQRAAALVAALPAALSAQLIDGVSTVGGGSAPGSALPTVLIALEHDALSAAGLEVRLRQGRPPIVARVQDRRVVLDLRTVPSDQDRTLLSVLQALVRI